MENIIRYDLSKKHRIKPTYRYDKNVFDQYYAIINNNKIQHDYMIWKSGRDYNTNRKIKIGGPSHRYLEKQFYIFTNEHNNNRYEGDYKLFTILDDIDEKEYHKETLVIRQGEEESNLVIDAYNESIVVPQQQVNDLGAWSDYVEFEGKKYGIPKHKNGVHREYNCMGKIIQVGEFWFFRDYREDSLQPQYGCELCGKKINGYYHDTWHAHNQ